MAKLVDFAIRKTKDVFTAVNNFIIIDPQRADYFVPGGAYRVISPGSQSLPSIPKREAARTFKIAYYPNDARRNQPAVKVQEVDVSLLNKGTALEGALPTPGGPGYKFELAKPLEPSQEWT
eukprot:TRINITY_DN261_c0_g1_i1.p1 TRINITY_DN261_c0_g1~~TRINITY_DN261_c0_g1_i1.p1  ORF type:complete len:137 (-),score=65.36 TRINITY_DN261_c0_g1_i1:9-371(-)